MNSPETLLLLGFLFMLTLATMTIARIDLNATGR